MGCRSATHLLYARLSSVNSEAVVQKICALEGAEDGELFASGMAAIQHADGITVPRDQSLLVLTYTADLRPYD